MSSFPTLNDWQELLPYLTESELEELDSLLAPAWWPEFRGHAAAIQSIRQTDEFMLSGPSETTKTWASCWLLDTLLREFPGARGSMLRKVRADMDSTVLETWRKVIAIRGGVTVFGGEKPLWYDYPNGSRLYIGGIDRPGQALSGERDFIYVNQAEELDKIDWEILTTRTTGRGGHCFVDGKAFTLLMGDCNPGPPTHWILHRPSLRLLSTTHKDNPSLYDDDGNITEAGKVSIKRLDNLTGNLRARLYEGRWASAEGVIYSDYDPGTHKIDPFDIPETWPIVAGVDFGFVNPGAVGIWAFNSDDWAHLVHEEYQSRKDFELWWLPKMEELQARYHPIVWYCDPSSPEKIEKMRGRGLNAVAAENSVKDGIGTVQSRLKPIDQGNGKLEPRLYIFRDALKERDTERPVGSGLPCGTAEEILGYVWRLDGNGNPTEEPVKRNDHALDEDRYAIHSYEKGLGLESVGNKPGSYAESEIDY